jgi:phage FluMu gp28-like protein
MKIKILDIFAKSFFNKFKYSVIAAGRQTGKTYSAVVWLVTELLKKQNSRGLWVDTTQNNLDKYVDRYFSTIYNQIWKFCDYSKLSKTIKLPNHSYIDLRSAERPENIEGFGYDYVVLNEAGIILKNENLFYKTIQPMTKNALVRLVGTPKGKNLFFKLFHTNDKNFKSFRFTCFDSKFWNKEDLLQIQKQVPELVWRQEYLAEFVDNSSTVFLNFEKCVEDYKIPVDIQKNQRYFMGVDLAKFTDYTVITVLDETGKLIDWQRFNQIDYTYQKTKIIEIQKKYNADVLIDSTGVGAAVFDDLKRVLGNKINGFNFTNVSKKELIENLIYAFEQKKIKIPKIPELINELEIFEYKINKSGLVSYAAPDGFNDDCVISLALAYQLIYNQPPKLMIDFF